MTLGYGVGWGSWAGLYELFGKMNLDLCPSKVFILHRHFLRELLRLLVTASRYNKAPGSLLARWQGWRITVSALEGVGERRLLTEDAPVS